MLHGLIDAITRLWFGHRTVDSARDWHSTHGKAKASRAEVDRIIEESKRK